MLFDNRNTSKILDSLQKPLWTGNILNHDPLLMLPTNPEELAVLLDTYSTDWWEVLSFLDRVAEWKGIVIDKTEVIAQMMKIMGEVNE